MERTLDETYYEQALISYLMKIGTISQPIVKHNNPSDYGITEKDAINARLRYLRANLRQFQAEFSDKKGKYLRGEDKYGYLDLNQIQQRVDKLSRNIKFLKARLKGESVHQQFDLERIKQIPMNTITKINPNGFFQQNPFRTEKEPSNSLFWYKTNNKAHDFSTGVSYSVIDLVMALNSCSFKEACKELSSL